MKTIIICDLHKDFIDRAVETFKDRPYVKVMPVGTDIFKIEADAIVSPANSSGYYRGGFDGILASKLPWGELERVVREEIFKKYPDRILPVGKVLSVKVPICNYKYLIVAPTMVRPATNIAGTTVPYMVMNAICKELLTNPEINSVVVMGLGTGVGGISSADCIDQMDIAMFDVMDEGFKQILHCD